MRINAFGKPAKLKKLDELSLAAVSAHVIADDIIAKILEFKPDAVLTYNRGGGFGHPDHKMAHVATAVALRSLAKKMGSRAPKFWVIAEPRERFDVEIGNTKTAQLKKAALEAHASQVAVGQESLDFLVVALGHISLLHEEGSALQAAEWGIDVGPVACECLTVLDTSCLTVLVRACGVEAVQLFLAGLEVVVSTSVQVAH
jgi:hypothetical protein